MWNKGKGVKQLKVVFPWADAAGCIEGRLGRAFGLGRSVLSEIHSSSGFRHLFGAFEHLLGTYQLIIISSYILLFYLLKTLIILMVLFFLLIVLFLSPTVPLYFDRNLSLCHRGYQMLLVRPVSHYTTVVKVASYRESLSLLSPPSFTVFCFY